MPGRAMPTVAVVDADADSRESIGKLLEGWGYRCCSGSSEVEIKKILAEFSPRILILDTSFLREAPLWRDWEVANVGDSGMRRTLPSLLVTTSRPSVEEAVFAVKHGACDYLPKPVDVDRLRVVLEECFHQHSQLKGNAVIQQVAEVRDMSTNGSTDFARESNIQVESVIDLRKTSLMDDIERQAILYTLTQTGGNVGEAARVLGLGPATVYRKIKRYGIRAKHFLAMSHTN